MITKSNAWKNKIVHYIICLNFLILAIVHTQIQQIVNSIRHCIITKEQMLDVLEQKTWLEALISQPVHFMG